MAEGAHFYQALGIRSGRQVLIVAETDSLFLALLISQETFLVNVGILNELYRPLDD